MRQSGAFNLLFQRGVVAVHLHALNGLQVPLGVFFNRFPAYTYDMFFEISRMKHETSSERSGSLVELRAGGAVLSAGTGYPTRVMGVLNVTPDSFFDGGHYERLDRALARAEEMVAEGAEIIDVGGASSRPPGQTYGKGAQRVSAAEEQERVIPVITEITRRWPTIPVSIDTWSAATAAAALDAGAHLVNDITALRGDPDMGYLVAEAGTPVILMHSFGLPGSMQHTGREGNVVRQVLEDLQIATERANDLGIKQIILDPGFGFGKSHQDNFRLIANTPAFCALGRPVLVAVSRKSSIGVILATETAPAPVEDRLFGSLGAAAAGVAGGASIVRTHDVKETVQMLRVMDRALASRSVGDRDE